MDFFQIAIDTEQIVENYYRDLAALCSTNEGIKNILTMLADDHRKHGEAFIEMKNKHKISSLAPTEAFREAADLFTEFKDKKNPFSCDMDQVKLYKKALELVKHKIRLYSEAISRLKDDQEKDIIERIIKEEKKQAHVLENIIEMVSKPNTWLENAEFYHLDEY